MKLRIACIALAMTLAPALAVAQACDHAKQAQSCATGTTFDAATGTCVPSPST